MKLSTFAVSIAALTAGAVLAYPRVQASTFEPAAKATPCNTKNACFVQTNHGSGPALKGISVDTMPAAFGSGAIIAQSNTAGAIYAFSKQFYAGEFESAGGNHTYALIAATDSIQGLSFIAEGPVGRVIIDGSGNVYAKGYVVISSDQGNGDHAAFAAATTSASIEDSGTAQLINGAGVVRFDSAFAGVIDVRNGYQVFLTTDGSVRAPLYVAQKFARGFTVRESEGGRSSVFFDYRIVAHRAGASYERLPVVNQPRGPMLQGGNP